jgi:hypothetical protein
MTKLLPVLAASLSVLIGSAAFMSTAEARGGGGFHDGGFHHGGFHGGGFRPPAGYGPVPGRRNPYARGALPWINMDYDDLLQEPANNAGSSPPNDCNDLLQRAMESGSSADWRIFNDCSHNR